MTLAANICWEVRPSTGNDNNGGGFAANSGGIDRSQNAGPWIRLNGTTVAGTAVGISANVSITNYAVNTNDIGNLLNVTGGINTNTGVYQIVNANGISNTWTLDRTVSTVGGTTNLAGNMGGAMLTIGAVMAQIAANGSGGNKVFVKAEAQINAAVSIALNAPAVTPTNAAMPNRLIGYTATRTDKGKPAIQLQTNTGLTALNITTAGWIIENFVIDCNSLGTSIGIASTGTNTIVRNCLVKNFTLRGIYMNVATTLVIRCEVTAGTSAATAAIVTSGTAQVLYNNLHDNACAALIVGTGATVIGNYITNNTGASSDGIEVNAQATVMFNTIYNCGQNAIDLTSANNRLQVWLNNVIVNSTGDGGKGATGAGAPADPDYDGNAYYNNGTNRVNMDDTTVNAVNGVAPYTNVNDVILVSSPFVNAAGGNYSLTSAAALAIGQAPTGVPNVTPPSNASMGADVAAGSGGGHMFRTIARL
jgi:hypothetical protein